MANKKSGARKKKSAAKTRTIKKTPRAVKAAPARKKSPAKRSAKTKVTTRSRSTTPRKAREVVRFVAGGPNDNLEKIDHIVVLMMENRSFDHMLGYLKLEGINPDVDGLDSTMANSHAGTSYAVHRLSSGVFEHDPGHGAEAVAQQLSNQNSGFVTNYMSIHVEDEPGLIMGYYNESSIPVYDFLARKFLICDRWFCSVPGATWPNRLYAIAGRSPSKDNKKVPFYDLPSFVRHLDNAGVSWGWYAHDMSTLRLIDGNYRVRHGSKFFWFDHRTWINPKNFLDHAASGDLRAVSWIDPNFVDWTYTGPVGSNDDHPPSDVMAGQDLVLKLFNAVVSSPAWPRTMLVILYDEHGGFYDHVEPENCADDNPNFRSYGARVPAIVVSPWVEAGAVSHYVFDHASLIKTILLRFCRRPDGTIPDMGARVTSAEQLGTLLSLSAPRPAMEMGDYQHLYDRIGSWRVEGFKKRARQQTRGMAPPMQEVTEFQEGIEAARQRLRKEGLPEGQP